MLSSPKLNDIGNNGGGVGGATDEDDAADEVKVFRTNDADEANYNIEDPPDELTADKTDVAFEADIETEPLGQRSAFTAQQRQQQTQTLPNLNLAFPSPSCELLLPMLMAPLASPLSPFAPYNNPLMRMSPMAQAANFLIRNSPSYQQHYAAAAAAAAVQAAQFRAAAAAPTFGLGTPFGANLLQPAMQPSLHNLGAATTSSGLRSNLFSTTPTSTRMSNGVTLNSPLSTMSNGLNGMTLLDKSQNRSVYKTQLTPKRSTASNSDGGVPQLPPQQHVGGGVMKTPKREKSREDKKDHVKKPCNAFMWYMRENRARLLKEEGGQQVQSAIINKKLGMEWQSLSKKEQQKYFDMAAKERELHQQMHPDWTARDNYAIKKKNKKKLREKSNENNDQKKCRARYGVDNQQMWCKHCKRKKRCLNVREVDSPQHALPMATSSVNMGIGGQQSKQQQGQASLMMLPNQSTHISSSSSNASSSALSRHIDSPSSTGMTSVGKRTESNASSNFDPNTPPPPNAAQLSNATQLVNAIAGGLGNFSTPKAEENDAFGPTGTPVVMGGIKPEILDDIAKPTPSHMHQLMAQHPQHLFNQQQLAAAAAAAAASGMQPPPYHNFMAAAAGLAAASAGFGSPHNFFRH